MELLHFDTESRKAIVRMTYIELLDLTSQAVHTGPRPASALVTAPHGAVEIQVVKD